MLSHLAPEIVQEDTNGHNMTVRLLDPYCSHGI